MNIFSFCVKNKGSEVAAAVPSGGLGNTATSIRAAITTAPAARDSGGYLLHFAAIACLFFTPLSSHAQTRPNDNVGPEATATIHIDKATLNTKIAATPAQEERGLMYVTHMPDNDGMIFVLPLGHAEFWMKNTLIPLSVAYIDKNGVILEIHDMAPGDPSVPDDQLPRTRSDSDQVQYALETNLHWFSLNSIKPGDKLDPPPATLTKVAAETSKLLDEVVKGTGNHVIMDQTNAPPH